MQVNCDIVGRHKISLGGRAGGLTAVEHRVLQLLGGTEAAAEDIINILRHFANKIYIQIFQLDCVL